MSFLSSIISPFVWLYKQVAAGVKASAPAAIVITEAVKTILANPAAGFLESIIDAVTGTTIATDAANRVSAIIPKILAAELAIVGLPDNPTQADILYFEQRVLSAFDVTSDNSRLYTVLGAEIYGIINTTVQSGKPITFAVLVADVEQAYLDYKKDLAANAVPLQSNLGGLANVAPAEALKEAMQTGTMSTATDTNPAPSAQGG